jgi:hypothetical protein
LLSGARRCGLFRRRRSCERRRAVVIAVQSIVAALAILALPACSLIEPDPDTKQQALNAVNDAIERLTNQSADWQDTLKDLQSKLTDDAQATIRNEVQNVIDRAIGAAGAEFRCNVDFIGTRVKQALLRIRAKLTGAEIDPREPVLCIVSPSSIDMSAPPASRNQVKLFGYDFDAVPALTLALQDNNQSMDATTHLTRQTHYQLTINLGSNGVPLTRTSQKLTLNWKDAGVADIPIIQPNPVPCQTSSGFVDSFTRLYVPPHTGGDKEYWGNGPSVSTTVTLYNVESHVDAEIQMSASETREGDTTASGSERFTIYTAPPGKKVQFIIGGVVDQFPGYVDTDWEHDFFDRGSGGPVRRYEFVGDTHGNDVEEGETGTSVKVTFNRIDFQLIDIGDCV